MALFSTSSALTTAFAVSSLLSTAVSAAPSSAYSLVADYSGNTFFSGFEPFTGADPTHGHVNYTDMAFAASNGLLGFNQYNATGETRAFVKVDTTNKAPNGRNAVRLTSLATFSVGVLAVMDIVHQPVAPGVWPAAWFLGTGAIWPGVGEIDVVEYVNNASFNAMTLHTAPGCSVANSTNSFAGKLQAEDCNSGNGNMGCGIQAPGQIKAYNQQVSTAGEAFNAQGGAIYVTEWTTSGINIWSFARSAVPTSLNSVNPSTAGFPTPLASFSGSGCDFSKAFQNMVMIINTDFCGDWAGQVWQSSGMAAQTGVATCDDFVANNPQAFNEAYWEFGSIKVHSSGTKPGKDPGKRSAGDEQSSVSFSTSVVREGADEAAVNATTSVSPHFPNATSTFVPEMRKGGRVAGAAAWAGAGGLRGYASDAPSTESKVAAYVAVFAAVVVFAVALV